MSFTAFVTIPTWLAILWRRYLAKQLSPAVQAAAPGSILVVRLDQLGDLVLTTPICRELKRLYPGARITLVVPSQFKAIFTTNRNVDEILAPAEIATRWLPARARHLIATLWFYRSKLRHCWFDLVISPRWDVDESHATLLCVLANAGRRVGHSSMVSPAKRKLNRWFESAFDLVLPPGALRHEVDNSLAIVEALSGEVVSRETEIRLTDSDRTLASELLKHHHKRRLLVAIGIGGRAASRKWPLERYADTIARLDRSCSVQPVIVCSQDEDAEASALSLMLPMPPYILSGLPLRAVCAVLERCQLFLGNDTGTAHLAAAMRCPTVVVSRHPANGDPSHANSPARFAPRGSQVRVLQPAIGAWSCTAFCRLREPHCILAVSVEQVVMTAKDLIPRPEPVSQELAMTRFALPPLDSKAAGIARPVR